MFPLQLLLPLLCLLHLPNLLKRDLTLDLILILPLLLLPDILLIRLLPPLFLIDLLLYPSLPLLFRLCQQSVHCLISQPLFLEMLTVLFWVCIPVSPLLGFTGLLSSALGFLLEADLGTVGVTVILVVVESDLFES